MSPFTEYVGELCVTLMQITACVSSAIWGELCLQDASECKETTSEGDEPP